MNTTSSNYDTAGMIQNEGKLTRMTEQQTSKIPSMFWLGLAGGSVLLSIGLKVAGHDKTANFIGLWVPSILTLGIYNKLVKEERLLSRGL
jgi:lipopolysaccharide export LptBFGC system permease protein LptF